MSASTKRVRPRKLLKTWVPLAERDLEAVTAFAIPGPARQAGPTPGAGTQPVGVGLKRQTHGTPVAVSVPAAILFLLLTTIAAAHGNDRYWAMLRDGRQLTGSEIGDLNDPRQNPRLQDTPLFDPHNPVRVVRDLTIQSELDGPFVEFANGDVLPGQVVGAGSIAPHEQVHPHLIVIPDTALPISDRQSGEVRVRLSSVRRIVLAPGRRRPYRPGLIVYRDGREATARSVRWSENAVRALTQSGILTAGLDELAEVHLPEGDTIAELLTDATWPAVAPDDLIATISTTNGGRLTYPRSMVQTSFSGGQRTKSLAVQPAWALDAIRLPEQSIVFRTYRRPEEIPLSALPVSHVEYRTAVHLWPWHRNRNVLGSTLRAGGISADLGVGTHSHTEITFDLPPHASRFYGLVGLDDSVGDGGCARCKVYRDVAGGTPLLTSGLLTGSQDATRIGPLDVQGARHLVLVTEFGDERRPPDTDPLDIRDHVDWLMPWVRVEPASTEEPAADLARWFAPLAGWTVADAAGKRISARPWWDRRAGRWTMALAPDADKRIAEAEPVELTRRVSITLRNAYLYVAAGRDTTDSTHHVVQLRIDGEPQQTTLNGDLRTNASPGTFRDRVWVLGDHVGEEAVLSLVLTPQGDGNAKPAGIVWGSLAMRPLIEGLPEDGQPIKPDVLLASLEPTAAVYRGRPVQILAGKLPDGTPLKILRYPFSTGFGVTAGTSLTYELDPSYRRFVAVLGLADGWQAAGPYEILLDGEVHWTSSEPRTFDRNTPGCQIDVPIPAGHKTIQLRLQGRRSGGAWAAAGFMLN